MKYQFYLYVIMLFQNAWTCTFLSLCFWKMCINISLIMCRPYTILGPPIDGPGDKGRWSREQRVKGNLNRLMPFACILNDIMKKYV